MSNSEPPTPRITSSLKQGPVLMGYASSLAGRVQDAANRKSRVLHELDMAFAGRARGIARQLRVLAIEFGGWTASDPGEEARTRAVMRLRDLEVVVNELLPPR